MVIIKKAVNELFDSVADADHRHVNYSTPERIAYLNRLNKLLKKKERQIMARVKDRLDEIRQRMESTDRFTQAYSLVANVQYHLKSILGRAHVYSESFMYKDAEYPSKLCSGIDGREPYMPVLDKPYCYLLHDLIDHSRLGENLFRIHTISIDIRLCDEHFLSLISY